MLPVTDQSGAFERWLVDLATFHRAFVSPAVEIWLYPKPTWFLLATLS